MQIVERRKKWFYTASVEEAVQEALFNIEKNHNDDLFVPRTALWMKKKVSWFCSYIWMSFKLSYTGPSGIMKANG